jgi:hypothetical protein
MNDLTTSYFNIEKSDKQPDGTLMVYGKATDDSMDIDQQICDAAWLDRAMPAWFKSGGNIREQHSSIAAGVAKEYEPKADGHYIMAHIVDPVSVKKVDAGVLRGFSIGIKSPRVVRDTKAANGRIIDGQIVEVSLVDRPANPNCQLVLAKSVDGESSLVQVEELSEIEKHGSHDQKTHGGGRGRGGAGGGMRVSDVSRESSAKGETSKRDAKQNVAKAQNKINESYTEMAKKEGQGVDRDRVMDAAQQKEDAFNHLNDAKNSIAAGKTSETVTSLNNAADVLDGEPQYDSARVYIKDLAAVIDKNPISKAVEADLEKHGSHDQKTHGGGRGRGGGAGGGAGASAPSGKTDRSENSLSTSQAKLIDTHAAEARGLADDAQRLAKQDSAVRPAARNLTSAAEHLNNASGAKTIGEAKSGIRRAKVSIDRAVTNLEDQNYNTEASHAYAFSKELNSFMTGLGNGVIKATDAELRKALQSALQLHSLNKSEETSMKDTVELPIEVVSDLLKFDAVQYEAARNALASLIEVEAGEMREGHNEIQSIGHLLQSVMHLTAWYEGEEAEGEVMEQEEVIERAAGSEKKMKPAKDETKPDFLKRCKDAGMEDDAATATWDKYMAAMADDAEKSAEISKCLECGCNQPGTTHGLTTTNDFANVEKPSHVTTAEMYAPGESPKSAEGEEPAVATEEEVKAEEPATEETPAVETTEVSADDKSADVEALVEQVVKSATESLKSEIAELVSAKEAALSKAMSLETELELAKSLAVAGGPSRTARPLNVKTTNDLLTKAAIYKAKANATTDPTLAKGYKSLAEEFLNKANEADNK